MVFSSSAFLFVFLPLFLCAYALLPWRNMVILLFSLLFFSWGESYYLLLLLGTVAINYLVGRRLVAGSNNRLMLGLGVGINLAILAYYKYFGFMVTSILGLDYPREDIPHLPLGISFFIFQSISYLVDVHRGTARQARSFTDLALYITMFPQLIAGPIVRYNMVADSIVSRTVTFDGFYRGFVLFVFGLSYKVLIANNVAEVADSVFAMPSSELSSMAAWIGALSYTLQIYFDFAGYSLMAIGIGRMLGFRFPRNFNYPYIAGSITDFWRRWHMSLSSWFRDYLYIPLGGNRLGPARTYLNLGLVFLLCGLWHGAAWTFVAWGLFHGLLLVVERAGLAALLASLPRLVQTVYTLLMVVIGWVLFRSDSLPHAMQFLSVMFDPVAGPANTFAVLVNHQNTLAALVGAVLAMPVLAPLKQWLAGSGSRIVVATVSVNLGFAVLLLGLCSMSILSSTYNPFIYFRF